MALDNSLKTLIDKCYEDYNINLSYYSKMENYYKNNSDVIIEKTDVDTGSTDKINCNYYKKYIKEERDYILGNPVTFINQDLEQKLDDIVKKQLAHWKKDHDKKLFRRALTYGKAFELYFIDKKGKFSGRILTPLNGYAYEEDDEIKLFLHIFTHKFEENTTYIDVYTNTTIYHLKNGDYIGEDEHLFGSVPVGICLVDDTEKDTIFEDIKTLQDAYEKNLSDLSHEISQYRQAYLKFINTNIDEADLPDMKKKGILSVEGEKADINWLIKNINDAFVQNTLKEIKEDMYELSSHINNNEQVPSNNSSLAMRTRQLSLENKCKSNADAMSNLIMDRIKFLFQYLYLKTGEQYDYCLITPKFTPSLPQDDLMMAQIISQLPDGYVSKETGRSQFSFIDNNSLEEQKIKKETEESMKINLDSVD